MAYSANQTKLLYKTSTENTFTKELLYLMEVPELGGAPEKIEVTTLGDTVKKFIPGIKDYGDLVFKFLYDNATADSNFRVLKGFDENGTSVSFQLQYPDGTAHEFNAIPSVKMDSGAVNGALTFSATMMLQSDVEVTDPIA